MGVATFNNTTEVVRDDLKKQITSNSKVSVAAACFSIYAYQALKDELEKCSEFRFIFTSPTFVPDQMPKERRESFRGLLEKRVCMVLSLKFA